ncbi:hypothetical protein PQC07_gp236 [Aeromonas phage D3]|nr:hypothetical protein PQC07_gp236 [Aeromonas phage D3]YP_010668788.1 hypothetical protein PQC08_gp235 [Aeromonas phage D6]QDJ97037.1 hypothetical protein D3_0039 [Aeromonas phage D3]QDJ97200.1 hypothetical protein D6_0040 [Aeromonas phage D6]QEP52344.1 hypothetical protein D9_0137 [Aeromonas phage D9]
MEQFRGLQPQGIFSHNCAFPGVPTEVAANLIGMSFNIYGVNHQIPFNPNLGNEGLESEDKNIETRNLDTYYQLKSLLGNFSREYTKVDAEVRCSNGLFMITFKCW